MKRPLIPALAGIVIMTALLLGMWIYYNRTIDEIEQQGNNAAVYDRHYVLVSEDTSDMWQSIYESAREAAAAENIYIEWIGATAPASYNLEDSMEVAIASRVDGIILYPGNESGISDQINEASAGNIPVVTVLNDCSDSDRISFVGINSYQMGQLYGEQLPQFLHEGTNRILILVNASMEEVNTNMIYSQISSVVEEKKSKDQSVEISTYSIDSMANFEAEEVIRDIFINSENLPDILICLDPVATECASQAIVDYNEVGNVNIIGYYATDATMDAIRKGLVPVTLTVDTEEIGRYSVDALNEYLSYGYVSNFFNISLDVIKRENL